MAEPSVGTARPATGDAGAANRRGSAEARRLQRMRDQSMRPGLQKRPKSSTGAVRPSPAKQQQQPRPQQLLPSALGGSAKNHYQESQE